MTDLNKNIDFLDEDFIKLPEIPKDWLHVYLNEDQCNFINRASQSNEPHELQICVKKSCSAPDLQAIRIMK